MSQVGAFLGLYYPVSSLTCDTSSCMCTQRYRGIGLNVSSVDRHRVSAMQRLLNWIVELVS